MAADNRRNPDFTDQNGLFGWDVFPGFYRVAASRHGCQGTVLSKSSWVPPPVTNLLLKLKCPGCAENAQRHGADSMQASARHGQAADRQAAWWIWVCQRSHPSRYGHPCRTLASRHAPDRALRRQRAVGAEFSDKAPISQKASGAVPASLAMLVRHRVVAPLSRFATR
jgi:hypothetical protein